MIMLNSIRMQIVFFIMVLVRIFNTKYTAPVIINLPSEVHQPDVHGRFSFLSYNRRAKWTDEFLLGLLRPRERQSSILLLQRSVSAGWATTGTPKLVFSLRGTPTTSVSPNRLNRQWVKMVPFRQIQKAGDFENERSRN